MIYKKIGDLERAALEYSEWLKIRLYENNLRSTHYHRKVAEAFLEKGIFPDETLKHAKQAWYNSTESSFYYPLTLGHAYVANDLYDEALRYYRYALSILPIDSSLEYFWKQVADASKHAKDKKRYKQMFDTLIQSIPLEYVSSRTKLGD